jgi:hypothetical protein
MDNQLIWHQPGEEIVETERHIPQSDKMMLMIVRTASDFHVINVLPKDFKFNANHYVTQMLGQLSD